MRHAVLAFALTALFAGPIRAGLRSEVLAPSVTVESNGGTGAGTIVSVRGFVYVLTCSHVVPESGFATCTLCDGRKFEGMVIDRSDKPDLALLIPLTADRAKLLCAEVWSGAPPPEGTDVWTVGSPGGLRHSLDKTVVNQVHDGYIVVNGGVWFGSSGGGVFARQDGKWRLTAVVARAAADPRSYPKTPAEAEVGLRAFLER